MEKSILIIAAILCSLGSSAQTENPKEFEYVENGVTYTMKEYIFCIYLRGTERSQSDEEAAAIQEKHLAHLGMLEEKHKLVMAGPFGDDTEKRGVLVFDLETIEEAGQLVQKDPAVQANRLDFECHPLWLAKGTELP